MIHDELVARSLWPGSEPVRPDEYRDPALLDSAVNRPFQAFGETEFYPGIRSKAAALFHSLACNHCFFNGNKRTALVTLDMFLTVNSYCLLASNGDVYELAKETAAHNEHGRTAEQALERIIDFLDDTVVPFKALRQYSGPNKRAAQEFYDQLIRDRRSIRRHPLNFGVNAAS